MAFGSTFEMGPKEPRSQPGPAGGDEDQMLQVSRSTWVPFRAKQAGRPVIIIEGREREMWEMPSRTKSPFNFKCNDFLQSLIILRYISCLQSRLL